MIAAVLTIGATFIWMIASEVRISRLERQYYELFQEGAQPQAEERKG